VRASNREAKRMPTKVVVGGIVFFSDIVPQTTCSADGKGLAPIRRGKRRGCRI
jgi:hypothetical protein